MKIEFVGWNYSGSHDKIWGYVVVNDGTEIVRFWGRRGNALRLMTDTIHNGQQTKRKKLNDGYRQISVDKLVEIWPTFMAECEQSVFWHLLSGK